MPNQRNLFGSCSMGKSCPSYGAILMKTAYVPWICSSDKPQCLVKWRKIAILKINRKEQMMNYKFVLCISGREGGRGGGGGGNSTGDVGAFVDFGIQTSIYFSQVDPPSSRYLFIKHLFPLDINLNNISIVTKIDKFFNQIGNGFMLENIHS